MTEALRVLRVEDSKPRFCFLSVIASLSRDSQHQLHGAWSQRRANAAAPAAPGYRALIEIHGKLGVLNFTGDP
jgi:hypothetical protein